MAIIVDYLKYMFFSHYMNQIALTKYLFEQLICKTLRYADAFGWLTEAVGAQKLCSFNRHIFLH